MTVLGDARPARRLASIQRTGTLLDTARFERRDGFVHALSQIVNFAPAPQLLLQIVQTESNFAALPRRRDDDSRRGNINAPQIHQPGHRRMAERADQFQRRLHLRRFDAMARLQLIHIQPRDHRQLVAHLRQRNHAQARIQRLHHIAVRVQLKHRHGDAARRVGARDVHLRHRVALGHADFQRARQDALDGNGINRRNQFQIPLHRRQIERDQIVAGLHARPAAQLVRRNHAVGLHLNVLDGELGVFIDELVQRPLARAPEQIKAEHRAEQDAQPSAPPAACASRAPGRSAASRPARARGATAGFFVRA